MTSTKFGDKLEELDLSQDEIDRLTKCMKDEKFRDLLREYAEEISDPENRKRYEEEIAMLERDRGMDVKFINPKPGHVLKTSVNGKQKCFVNICTNENLGKPQSRPSMQGSTRGMQWSIPHSVSQAREDVDKAGTKCMVYDVVFHPDTYYLLKKNDRFKKMIHDTALDAVERQFGIELDKVNVRTPKMAFKGLPMSSVIRTPTADGSGAKEEKQDDCDHDVDVRLKTPYPPAKSPDSFSTKPKQPTKMKPYPNLKEEVKKMKQIRDCTANGTISSSGKPEDQLDWGYIEPEYSIMHRGYFEMQDYCLAADVRPDTWPKELVVNIDLPLLSAANSVNLEVFERRLRLDSVKPAKYKLDFELPYPVDENKGFAKFDKSRHRLTVTLEVLPAPPPPKLVPFMKQHRDDLKFTDEYEAKTTDEVDVKVERSMDREVGSKSTNDSKILTKKSQDVTESNLTLDTDPTQKKNGEQTGDELANQQPTFVEDGRRHYQQGSKWSDNDGATTDDKSASKSESLQPLSKSSAFLIDMVMKYEGLIRRCPQYAFIQDDQYITFVIEVPHIFEESLWYAVYDNMLQFCCLSECLDDDMVNSVFQLWIEFDAGCSVDPQRSRVDVSGNNAVFCLCKTRSSHEWQTMRAGFDKENLETRHFATHKNVCDLYTLVYDHARDIKVQPYAVCKVAKQENDLLVLHLEPKKEDGSNPSLQSPIANSRPQLTMDEMLLAETIPVELLRNKLNKLNKLTAEATTPHPPSPVTTAQHATDNPEPVLSRSFAEGETAEGAAEKKAFYESLLTSARDVGDYDDDDGDDSDDDEPAHADLASRAGGAVTIQGDDGEAPEVVRNHTTRSAVKLAAKSIVDEIDDDL